MDIGEYRNCLYHSEGLFSVIYKAATTRHDGYFAQSVEESRKMVALKVTQPSVMEPPHDSKREAQLLKSAASDRVIPLLETFNEPGSRFVLVFPFMHYNLSQLLHSNKVTKLQARSALKDMFSALAFIHERGLIHRDVKPSNILLKTMDGPAYLADFGIAWAPDTVKSEPHDAKITDVGTTCYRPPELLFGNKKYGCELDLWAAGCTVAETVVPDHPTLFDSGELGSDLALIASTFSKLGTPNLDVWPVRSFIDRFVSLLIRCRKLQNFRTGARCSSLTFPLKRGRTYSQARRTSSKTLSASWSATRVKTE